jgi:PleD family two-component response regulator
MSDTVIISLIGAAVILIVFFTVVFMFRHRINEIGVSQKGLTIKLSPEEKQTALENLNTAEVNKASDPPPAPEIRSRTEEQINRLTTKIQKRILWVDNQPSGNRYEMRTLQPLGLEIKQVLSNQEAYQELKASQYALVITDIGRTDQKTDGLDLVSTLSDQQPGLPVIVYTSFRGVKKHGQEAAHRGATGIAATPSELVSLVLKHIGT